MYQSIGFINRQSPEDLQLTSDGSLFVPKCIVQYLTAYQINGIRTINRKLKEVCYCPCIYYTVFN